MFRSLTFALTLVASGALVQAGLANYRVHHRILDASAASPPSFELRGTLSFPSVDASSPPSALAQFVPTEGSKVSSLTRDEKSIPKHSLYQVALEKPSDMTQEDWSLSSIPACHLTSRTADIISLLLDPSSTTPSPFSLNYHIINVPRSGECPKRPTRPDLISFVNTTVVLSRPHEIPSPLLRVPPPLSPQGQPIAPPPEKTLIQKYWIYAVPIVILLLMSGPEEEAQKQ